MNDTPQSEGKKQPEHVIPNPISRSPTAGVSSNTTRFAVLRYKYTRKHLQTQTCPGGWILLGTEGGELEGFPVRADDVIGQPGNAE